MVFPRQLLDFAFVGVLLGLTVNIAYAVNCFQCTSNKEECTSGQCQGDYCSKIMAKNLLTNDILWSWGCTNSTMNARVTAGCQKTTVTDQQQQMCYCQDKNFCNSVPPSRKISMQNVIIISTSCLVFSIFR